MNKTLNNHLAEARKIADKNKRVKGPDGLSWYDKQAKKLAIGRDKYWQQYRLKEKINEEDGAKPIPDDFSTSDNGTGDIIE